MIKIRNLTYHYPGESKSSLDQLSFDAGPGLHVLLGNSGSGKSTILQLCNGAVPNTTGGRIRGRVRCAGQDPWKTPVREMARYVGFLFGDPELQGVGTTVARDVAFGPENLGLTPGETRRRVAMALERCQVSHLRDHVLMTLSGGERQLVALAGVIAMEASVLCLDEPLSQLDDRHRRTVLQICTDLSRQEKTVLIAEHRTGELIKVADSVTRLTTEPIPHHLPQTEGGAGRTGEILWTLRDVTLGHGDRVVAESISAHGRRGSVVAITGANGSGKTSLLRAIAGFLTPLAGECHKATGSCAYLPQNPAALLWRASVRAELASTIGHRRRGDLDTTLREFGLDRVAGKYPGDLSTGQRQRAALAAVLTGEPDLVLLDEPTRGMDVESFHSLVAAIHKLRDNGSAIVLATHDHELVRATADSVLHMTDGVAELRGVATSTPSEVLR